MNNSRALMISSLAELGTRYSMRFFAVLLAIYVTGCGKTKSPIVLDATEIHESIPKVIYCTGMVDVQGGVVPLAPGSSGKVAEVTFSEGQQVREGSVLLRLVDEQQRIGLERADLNLEEARRTAMQSEKFKAQHAVQLKQLKEQVGALQSHLENAKLRAKMMQELANLNQIGRLDVLVALGQIDEAKRSLAAEEARIELLQLEDPNDKAIEAQQLVKGAELAIQEARLSLSSCELKSPLDAIILRINVQKGVQASATQPAIVLAPLKPRVVRVPLDPEFADIVRHGMSATVSADTGRSDSIVWKGTVDEIALWFTQRRSVALEASAPGESRSLECTIKLDQLNEKLPTIGLKVRVQINPKVTDAQAK